VDSINIADPNDWYKFHVDNASSVTIGIISDNPAHTVGLEFARFNPIDLSILPATNSFLALRPPILAATLSSSAPISFSSIPG